jgi:hypothetical protein
MRLIRFQSFVVPFAFVVGLAVSANGFAQAPAGSTGQCKDGSYTSVEKKRGACAGHGGVKDWYASDKKTEEKSAKKEAKSSGSMAAPSTSTAPPASTMAAPAAAGATTRSSDKMTQAATKKMPTGMRAEAAPGGGAGKVWVNSSTHVYHCSGDEWYGKTKSGEYMTEAEAKAKGAHASHGKACG